MLDEIAGIADPSSMTYCNQGKIVTRRGFPVSIFYPASYASALNNKQARLYDRYSCRRFLGFLGEVSTSIINAAAGYRVK